MENTNPTNPSTNGGAEVAAANQPERQAAPTMNPEALAEAFAKALNTRTDRAERSVARSFAEQYGMTESEVTALLEKAKADKAKAIPPEVQQQIDTANERANNLLITAEVKNIGSEMGLIDAETALLLLDRTNIKVNAEGTVTGVKEALEALKGSKAFLFGQAGAWGQKQGGSPATMSKSEIAQLKDRDERRKAIAANMNLFRKG